jgi:hypothetical protein
MSVCPPVHVEQLGCHWIDLIKFDVSVFFENLPRKFKFYETDHNNRYFT